MLKKIDDLAIIIPVKNEEHSIGEIIDKAREYSDEILVVDGHSKDNTIAAAKKFSGQIRIIQDDNKGKGDALRKSVKEVKNDIVLFIDGDGCHEISDIPKLVNPIIAGEADMVIGSRVKGGSDEAFGTLDSFFRTTGSHLITILINIRWKVLLTDNQNGFRAIRKNAFLDLGLVENKTTIEQEMVMKALKKGYRIKEIASHEYARKTGNSKIKLYKVWPFYIGCFLKNFF